MTPEDFLIDQASDIDAELDRASQRLLERGAPESEIRQVLSVGRAMLTEQAACAARAVGIADPVVVH